MRVADAVGPDLRAGASDAHERIVSRHAVAAVVADGAGVRVLAEIRNDAEDLADERIQPLRVETVAATRITGAAIAAGNVQHAPVGVAGARGRIERDVAERMDPAVEGNAKQLAGAALEGRVRGIRVRPFDQHAFVVDRSGRRDRRGGRVAGDIEAANALVVRYGRPGQRHLLEMDGVKAAVARIVRIQLEADEAAGQTGVRRQFVEQAGADTAAVEIEVGRGALRPWVQDIERPGEIVDEEAAGRTRLLSHDIEARE